MICFTKNEWASVLRTAALDIVAKWNHLETAGTDRDAITVYIFFAVCFSILSSSLIMIDNWDNIHLTIVLVDRETVTGRIETHVGRMQVRTHVEELSRGRYTGQSIVSGSLVQSNKDGKVDIS